MKRVLCLYRVSTKGQVDKKDDIPMQRRECMAFIERMEDWCFYDELMEKGVSGYKVSASKRDAILEIRALAEKKKFDVLLVFMFDRLGRREDETPFLVQWFIEHGVVDIAVTAFAHATNQVRGVLGLCQIFCRSTGCTFG